VILLQNRNLTFIKPGKNFPFIGSMKRLPNDIESAGSAKIHQSGVVGSGTFIDHMPLEISAAEIFEQDQFWRKFGEPFPISDFAHYDIHSPAPANVSGHQ
jgi:hypothetical protein